MAEIRETRTAAIGTGDGTQRAFTTPSTYRSGFIHAIVNGLVYHSSDAQYGWTETDDDTIEFVTAPSLGDVILAIYQEGEVIDTGNGGGGVVIEGRPYAP